MAFTAKNIQTSNKQPFKSPRTQIQKEYFWEGREEWGMLYHKTTHPSVNTNG
jgi:hypothetical protein